MVVEKFIDGRRYKHRDGQFGIYNEKENIIIFEDTDYGFYRVARGQECFWNECEQKEQPKMEVLTELEVGKQYHHKNGDGTVYTVEAKTKNGSYVIIWLNKDGEIQESLLKKEYIRHYKPVPVKKTIYGVIGKRSQHFYVIDTKENCEKYLKNNDNDSSLALAEITWME